MAVMFCSWKVMVGVAESNGSVQTLGWVQVPVLYQVWNYLHCWVYHCPDTGISPSPSVVSSVELPSLQSLSADRLLLIVWLVIVQHFSQSLLYTYIIGKVIYMNV